MSRHVAHRLARLRLAAGLGVLGLIASVLLVSPVLADAGNVTIHETSNATNPENPGGTYAYKITATVGTLPVDSMVVSDASFDYPQISVTSATYTRDGAGPNKCGTPRPDNARCVVGHVNAGTTIVATVNVRVNPDVNIACDKPGAHGTLDTTVRSNARATWTDTDGSFTKNAPLIVTNLDCTGYNPNSTPPTPNTTITGGPSGTTTQTTVTFSFAASGATTGFECKRDAGVFSPCASPQTYSSLATGVHTFSVRARNGISIDPSPATRSWTVTIPFTDIGGSVFKNDIIWLYNEGITGGCTATTYCPRSTVTRDQMASFLVRALKLPSTTRDFFTDDEGNIHESNINRLAAAGITVGCTATRYCPSGAVKRDQMASFLVRAFNLPSSTRNWFTDDNGNKH
jgi:hypothetical protein